MELKKGYEYYPVWAFASPLIKINCGFIKCFFCTKMEILSPRSRKPLYIEELNTYKCLKYPEGIPQEIIIEKADAFEDMFYHPGCEDYDRCIYNVREGLIAYITNNGERSIEDVKHASGDAFPPWFKDVIRKINETEE